FDSKWLWPLPRPIRMGDELWIYYVGMNVDHSSRVEAGAGGLRTAVSRAVMRLDGFVSADFDYSGGSLISPPLRFAGSRLRLNLDTGGGGGGRVELLDAAGVPIPGYTLGAADPLNGNSVRMAVTWGGKADVSALAGKPIRLHLRMRSAKLYAFQRQALRVPVRGVRIVNWEDRSSARTGLQSTRILPGTLLNSPDPGTKG
ncbi:MAG: hypothetical protein DMG07_28570, partial [Acidobacteria bacterium]